MPVDQAARVFQRFENAAKKKPLLGRISEKLVAMAAGGDASTSPADKELVLAALQRLVAEGILDLPLDAVSEIDFQSSFLETAQSALSSVLVNLKHPEFAGILALSVPAIKLINNSFNRCGSTTKGNPPPGPDIKVEDGQPVVVYFVEEDANGSPLLPKVDGSPKTARKLLMTGFQRWAGVLNLGLDRTDDPAEANLFVTGRDFGREVPDSVLALTDIGPPRGVQLRMVFDTAEAYSSRDQFIAVAAHELGHALGIHHSDVASSGDLMSPFLSQITEPGDADKRAAQKLGWELT